MFPVDPHDDEDNDDDGDDDDIAIIEQNNGDASNDQAQIVADNELAERIETGLGDHAEREDVANHRHGKDREATSVSHFVHRIRVNSLSRLVFSPHRFRRQRVDFHADGSVQWYRASRRRRGR